MDIKFVSLESGGHEGGRLLIRSFQTILSLTSFGPCLRAELDGGCGSGAEHFPGLGGPGLHPHPSFSPGFALKGAVAFCSQFLSWCLVGQHWWTFDTRGLFNVYFQPSVEWGELRVVQQKAEHWGALFLLVRVSNVWESWHSARSLPPPFRVIFS